MKVNPIARAETQFLHGDSSAEAIRIIGRLRDAGFVALLAGGCVRDALLGKQPKDYDVATDATPDSVRQLFGKKLTLAFGASFGVIGVLPERQNRTSDQTVQPTEVATFRSDGTYTDGRRPDSVAYGNAEQDALRRDFTINGLFFDPIADEVIDYVGGQLDLHAGLLRTIGDPELRFGEDRLRMLRAVRFATTLGFRIDPPTRDAIRTHADHIAIVSGERIGAEMRRVLGSQAVVAGLRHLIDCRLESAVFPEISGLDLSRLENLLEHLDPHEFSTALACILINTEHPEPALRAIAGRWKLSNEEVRQTSAAIEHAAAITGCHQLPWSVVQPVLIDRDAPRIVGVARAMVKSEGVSELGIERAVQAMSLPREQLDPPALLTGDDLRGFGVPSGPQYRSMLQAIRDAQLDGKITTRGQAITWLGLKEIDRHIASSDE